MKTTRTTKSKAIRPVINARMFELLDYSIKKGLVGDRAEWCEKVGINYRNFSQIRNNMQGFTDEQKIAAANLAKVDMNWIFGRTDQMFPKVEKLSPVEMIEEGLRQLKAQNKPAKPKKSA